MAQHGVLQSTLANMLTDGFISLPVLLFTEYKRIGLIETEVMLLVQLILFKEKEQSSFPTVAQLVQRTTLTEDRVAFYLQSLIRKNCIKIEEGVNECGLRCERYSLAPLREQLAASLIDREDAVLSLDSKGEYDNLFPMFEQEFGRGLSPLECEILVKWIDEDKHSSEIIVAALREAVFSDKLNFRYIDRILLDWQRKGIKTAQQSAEYAREFRQIRSKPKAKTADNGSFTFYNWVTQDK